MSIIAASLYRNGKRIGPVSLDQPVRCATDRSEFVWIGLFEPSEAELRVAQAQLVGWLEGLFHGIQATLMSQQMAARAQLEEMRQRGLPSAGESGRTGAYL